MAVASIHDPMAPHGGGLCIEWMEPVAASASAPAAAGMGASHRQHYTGFLLRNVSSGGSGAIISAVRLGECVVNAGGRGCWILTCCCTTP